MLPLMNKATLKKHIGDRLTIRQIAAKMGCSYSNVRYWLRKHGLQTRRGPHGRIESDESLPRKCGRCGETDPGKFYGAKRKVCGPCHNLGTIRRGKENRRFMIEYLGGSCIRCGFNEFDSALDVHHVDPSKKDPSSTSMRSWSKKRIIKELNKCVLLCKNCHAGVHAEEVSLGEVQMGARLVWDQEGAGSTPAAQTK